MVDPSTPQSILLVDPFRNLLNAYRMVLEEEGYLVELAASIAECQRLLSKRRYSVIITEYFPPPEETCPLMRSVKRQAPETCLIMVTNVALDERSYRELFQAGLDDILLKPYSPEKILVHIERGLRLRALKLEKMELEKRQFLDPATGRVILNAECFLKRLRQELKRAKRHQRSLSLLLTRFPPERELEEGVAGFCTELVKVLRLHVREEDILGRENGGCGILLPETDEAGTGALEVRLRRLVQNHPPFSADEKLRPILKTLSFQSYSYPKKFVLPESLRAVLEGVENEYGRR